MYRNAIEDETRLQAARLVGFLRDRDRGVLLGLLFCLAPFPPMSLVGIIVTAFNLRLIARGRLAVSERRLVLITLMLGSVNFLAGIVLFAWLASILLHLPTDAAQTLRWLLDRVFGRSSMPALPPGMQRV